MSGAKPLSVIVVTHNHAPYLARCLDSLIPPVASLGGEIIVVDNCSEDGSAAIAGQYRDMRLCVNQKRRGFAANCNYGMALAQGRYLLLLNPDTEVLPGALENLISFMDSHPQVGLCGAQLLFPNGQIQPSPRRFPTLGSFIARRTPLRVFMQNSRFNQAHLLLHLDHSWPQAVDWLLGACLLVRRQALEEVGPLDEGYFLYVEDIDWARRMHRAGWQVYYVPSAQIIHHHLAVSDKKFLSRRTWIHTLSMLRYTRKFLLPPIPWLSIRENKTAVWAASKQ
ncbi:MAG: glycosyltransferase family 2 protein [Anaerolineae bacterium]